MGNRGFDVEGDAASHGHVAQLASDVVNDGREINLLLVWRGICSPRQAGEPLERAGDLRQPDDVALECLDNARGFGVRAMGHQQPRRNLQDTERLADFMADQAAEIAQLRGLARDRIGVSRDERVDGLLLQHAYGLLRAAEHQHRRGSVAPLAERRGLAGEETLEDLAQDLIFTQQLVDRSALIEPEQSKLASLGHHAGIGGDLLVRRRAEVGGDFLEQLRNMIEELVARKDVALLDGQQGVEPLQPGRGQNPMVRSQPRRKMVDRRGKVGNGHGNDVRSDECNAARPPLRGILSCGEVLAST